MQRNLRVAIAFLMIASGMAWAQPTVVTTLPGGENFISAGGYVYFRVGVDVWRTDGTDAGTFLLASGADPNRNWTLTRNATERDGVFYFLNDENTQLWRSNGTTAGTYLLKESPISTMELLGVTDDYVYFAAYEESTGTELYRTNGTVAGTILVKDINPGAASSSPTNAGAVGTNLFFGANNGVNGLELWMSDGTNAGTAMVEDINPGAANGFTTFTNVFSFGGRFYFGGTDVMSGVEPWISDGTAGGTFMLADATSGGQGSVVHYGIAHDGHVYFIANADLWRTAGTQVSTTALKRVGIEETEMRYHHFRIYNDKVFFWANDMPPDGQERLWTSDGTSSGTNVVYTSNERQTISFFEEVNGYLVFSGSNDGMATGIFRTDGTSAGTEQFADANTRDDGRRDLTVAADLLFYAEHDGFIDLEGGLPESQDDYFHLFESDAQTTASMRTLWGINTVGSNNITAYNDRVIFTTHNDHHDAPPNEMSLWIYDPAVRPEPTPTFTLVDSRRDEDVKRLIDGGKFVIPSGDSVNIRFNSLSNPGSVVFEVNGARVRTETQPPYSLAGDVNGDYSHWRDAEPGEYTLTATAYSQAGGQGTPGESLTITFTIECGYWQDCPGDGECTASGTILREYWDNVSGTTVASIPTNGPPTSTSQLTLFEGPTNSDTNYGARIRGYICPPTSGSYTFWIASNDHSELWLSTDDSPANKRRIASLTRATNPREWTKFASQQSAPIALVAGQRYYIEALHKQGVGGDHIAVGWQLPDGTMERPIAGSRLSPAEGGGENMPPSVNIIDPEDNATFDSPATITIQTDASDPEGQLVKVEFFANGAEIGEVITAPYNFTWENVPAGNYELHAVVTDSEGQTDMSDVVTITVNEGDVCTASGTITWEFWDNVPGTSVSDIPVDTPPTSVTQLTQLETPQNIGINYGSRIRGYICPLRSGPYTVYIASNDHSQVWLSTDDNPANKQLIAYVTRATNYREFKGTGAMPTRFHLEEGKRYYIEVLHKQGIGSDHLTVGWASSEAEVEIPIPGMRLSPYMPEDDASGAMELLSEQVTVYPNPASVDQREITIGGYEGIAESIETQVDIINLTGDVVYSESIRCGGGCGSYVMKIAQPLVPGVYLVTLKGKNARFSKRLLVK